MVNKLVRDIDGCERYIDDVVIYSDNWSDHVSHIKRFFQIIRKAKLTINLMKSEFTCEILRPHCRSRAGKTLRLKNSNHLKITYLQLTKRISRYGRILQKFCLNFRKLLLR